MRRKNPDWILEERIEKEKKREEKNRGWGAEPPMYTAILQMIYGCATYRQTICKTTVCILRLYMFCKCPSAGYNYL